MVQASWPSGPRRNVKVSLIQKLQLPLSSGVGSNPTLVTTFCFLNFVGHVAIQYVQSRRVVILTVYTMSARSSDAHIPESSLPCVYL